MRICYYKKTLFILTISCFLHQNRSEIRAKHWNNVTLHEICDKIHDREICIKKKFWSRCCEKTSQQILLRLFQPKELIYRYILWNYEENRTNHFEEIIFAKFEVEEEEAHRTTLGKTVLKISTNFDLHLFSILGTENIQINVIRKARSHPYKSTISKKSGHYRTRMQWNTIVCFEKRTFSQLHCAYLKMHFWNARRQPRPIRSKETHDIIKKAGLKSTSGRIGSTQVRFSQ